MNFRLAMWTILICVLGGVSVAFFLKSRPAPAALPVVKSVPDFSLAGHDGNPIALKDLKGKVWAADFFFASCSGICPTMQKNLTQAHKAFAKEPNFRMLSITVDPERDTVEILSEYSKNWDADAKGWLFVTGDRKAIYQLARHGFLLTAEPAPKGEDGGPDDFIHSEKTALVDKKGQIRGYYDATNPEAVAQMIQDARALLAE